MYRDGERTGRVGNDHEEEVVSETTRKTWDGHAVALSLGGRAWVVGEWVCPHDGQEFHGEATPPCHRAYVCHTEGGVIWAPHHRCVPGEYWDDVRFDVFDGQPPFQITQAPVPVRFWFEGYDSDEFHVEPLHLDADGTYEVPQAAEVLA